ncbi:MAG TPA: outer membrane protein assembly factor BamD [Polyangiaceae bacterium]|jgi:hypothetical protein
MREPRRLRSGGTSFERDLLASARVDAGSKRGLERTLAAMGGGTLGVVAATTAAKVGGKAAYGAVLVKGLGALLLVGTATVVSLQYGGLLGNRSGERLETPARLVASTTPAVAPPLARAPSPSLFAAPRAPEVRTAAAPATKPAGIERAPAPPAPRAEPVPPATEHPPAETSTSRPPTARAGAPLTSEPPSPQPPAPSSAGADRSSPGPATAAGATDLPGEIASLDRVRRALAQSDSSAALRELQAYDRTFPAGLLADEATVLRVDALEQAKDPAAATAVARRFLAVNPRSPHAAYLRRVLERTIP